MNNTIAELAGNLNVFSKESRDILGKGKILPNWNKERKISNFTPHKISGKC